MPGSSGAQAPPTDRLGTLLPQRRLGASGPMVTNLGVGGHHVGAVSERAAQALIEKALEEGVRFFDNAPLYSNGLSEERYGRFLTPRYRDVAFVMTKTLARDGEAARKDLDASLSRMKTEYVDLWQLHALESPADVDQRMESGVLDAFLEARAAGRIKHMGFTCHGSPAAHLRMLEVLQERGVTAVSAQMPVNPADPHHTSFVTQALPAAVAAGVGVLAMKTLAFGRFFGGNQGWARTHVSVPPAIPDALSLAEVFGFVWSLPITTLISGMESEEQVVENAALARKSWALEPAERQRLVDAMEPFAGLDLEFYKG